jgi:hypothetical protein
MTGFLDLPGEIRNRIYTLIFPKQQILLRFFHHKKSFKSTSGGPCSDSSKRNRQLYAVSVQPNDAGHHQHELVFSAQLLRVCRKIHDETLPLLYTSTALHFESMRAINCFLNGASSQGMGYTTQLAITHHGYGEPVLTSDAIWKAKHDHRWLATCKEIAKTMKGIQHLKLCLQICDWPCQLNLSAKWAKPLFFLKGADGLNRVDIYLHSCSFQKERLESAARVVEREMTSERGQAQRQLEKSLQEIAKLRRKRYTQPKRRVLKDITNVACGPGSEMLPKVSKALKVLTIK